jgi:hypothetical protein
MSSRIQSRVDPTNPQPGYYTVSLNPKGWAQPVRIVRRGNLIQIVVNGLQHIEQWNTDTLADDFAEAVADGRLFEHQLFRVILFGKQCDEATYLYRLAVLEHARRHEPWHPCLHPERPIDLAAIPADDF